MQKVLGVAIVIFTLTGCSQSVQDYQQFNPQLDVRQFFRGQADAYGVMQNWQGKQNLHFTARLCGVWQQNQGDLYEIFQFSDGRTDKRHWQLQVDDAGGIVGTAGDVVGQATGQIAGNSMQFAYTLRIPQTDGAIDVTVDDWMYLVAPDKLINRSTLHKFGLEVGQLTLAIQQTNANANCQAFITEFEQTPVSPPVP